MTEDLRLLDGTTLAIEPGVLVEIEDGKNIKIDGLLVAIGEETRPVVFTRAGSAAWGVLQFTDFSEDAIVDEQLRYVSGSVLQHCIVEHGSGILVRFGAPLISNCTIRRHQSSGIRVEHGAPVIVGNEIYENSTELDPAAGNGAGIIAFTDKPMTISHNVVRDNQSVDGRFGGGGICAYGDGAAAITIVGNEVIGNTSSTNAGGIFAYNSIVEDNLVALNRSEHNGGGIHVIDSRVRGNLVDSNESAGGGGIFAEDSEIRANGIVRNRSRSTFGGGIYAFGSGTISHNTVVENLADGPSLSAGIYVSGDPTLDHNTILRNRGYGLYTGNPAQSPLLDARGNYWGSSDDEAILATLYDWYDDSERGLVDTSEALDRPDEGVHPPPPSGVTAAFVGRAVEVRWSKSPEAVGLVYAVHVSRDGGYPRDEGFDAGEADSLRIPMRRLETAAVYTVSVSARRRGSHGWSGRSALSERLELVYRGHGTRPPERPANRAPAMEPSDLSTTPTLVASPFADRDGEPQGAARWQITATPGEYWAPILDTGAIGEPGESYTVEPGVLASGKRYYWRVSQRDAAGNWSMWSEETAFSTPPQSNSRIAGPISGDVAWSLAASPYVVTGNTLVVSGASLTIDPGVTVKLEPGVSFMVRGRLVAAGAEGREITFTGNGEKPWGRFVFAATSVDAALDDEGRFVEGSILEHAVVEGGGGIVVDESSPLISSSIVRDHLGSGITIRNGGPTVVGNRIVDNTTEREGGGIYVYTNDVARIENNFIAANHAAADGGGIFAYGYRSTTGIRLLGNEVSGNSSGGNGGGIYASRATISGNRVGENRADSAGGGIYTTFSIVDGNVLEGNVAVEGGGIYAERNSTIRHNRVSGNSASSSRGGGVYINYWGRSAENEVFSFNEVTDNRTDSVGDTGGVFVLGELAFEQNDIFANTGYQLYNGNTVDLPTLAASDCYWGTDDREKIEAAIFHHADDERLGLVTYEPYAREKRGEREQR